MASFRSNITAPRVKPTLSIRARLVILALLAVVPLMLDRVRLLEASRTERIEAAGAEVLDLARRGADRQRDILATARGMLLVVARAYVTALARGETCNMYLSDLARNVPGIKGMSIIGSNARIKCSTLASAVGIDVSDREYYRGALDTRNFFVSDHLIERARGNPAMIVAYPTEAIDPNVNAVVIAAIDLQWIDSVATSIAHRPGVSALLIDGSGAIIAGDRNAAGAVEGESALAKEVLARNEGVTSVRGLDGIRRIFGFTRAPAGHAYLAFGFDEIEILQRIDREILIAYVQLGIFGLLVLLLAWFGGERLIVDPIRSLVRMATRIGRGESDVRPSRTAWAAEFEPLAAALTDTARKLAERERDLRAANEHLEELASMDSLSGLANRRGFDARLTADWKRAGKLGRPVALLMIDVDHFKLFNDRYGHVEGDVCLRRVGKLLMDIAQGADDLPARYGGEEFALLLPGVDIDTATDTGQRLRRAVEDLCIAHAASPNGQVTVSVGVASLIPGVAQDAERLVEAADYGLYAAKRRGRNTVVAHSAVVLTKAS
jgi:diguanylate cyclase (GGDEF)-like protein